MIVAVEAALWPGALPGQPAQPPQPHTAAQDGRAVDPDPASGHRVPHSPSVPPNLLRLASSSPGGARAATLAVSHDARHCAVLVPGWLDVRRGQRCVGQLPLPPDPEPAWQRLAWSPDSRWVAMSLSNGALLVYDLESRRCLCDLQRGGGSAVHAEPAEMAAPVPGSVDPPAGLVFVPSSGSGSRVMLLSLGFGGRVDAFQLSEDQDGLRLDAAWLGDLGSVHRTVTAAAWHAATQQLVIGGTLCTAAQPGTAHADGSRSSLTLWRIEGSEASPPTLACCSSLSTKLPRRISLQARGPTSDTVLSSAMRLASSIFKPAASPKPDNEAADGPRDLAALASDSRMVCTSWSGLLSVYDVAESTIKPLQHDISSEPAVCAAFLDHSRLLIAKSDAILTTCKIGSAQADKETATYANATSLNALAGSTIHSMSTIPDAAAAFVLASFGEDLVLVCAVSASPVEVALKAVEEQPDVDINNLCKQLGVHADVVFKALWQRVPKTARAVQQLLSNISDDAFVLAECLDDPHDANLSLARSLLELVVARTAGFTFADVEAELTGVLDEFEGQKDTKDQDHTRSGVSFTDRCMARMRALKYLDRLDTFEAVHRLAGSSISEYGRFRDADLTSVAADIAASSRFEALETLFTRHGHELLPLRLSLLGLIPETADPATYAHLLPRIDKATGHEQAWTIIRWRKPDWTSSKETRELLELVYPDEIGSLARRPSTVSSVVLVPVLPHTYPATSEALSAWASQRILQIDRRTGLADLALSFTRLAMERGIPGLERTYGALRTTAAIIDRFVATRDIAPSRSCNPPLPADIAALSATEVAAAGTATAIMWLLQLSTETSIVADVRQPIFEALEIEFGDPRSDAAQNALTAGLCQLARCDPESVVPVFRDSRTSLAPHERLIVRATDLAVIFESAVRGCADPSSLNAQLAMLSLLPQSMGGEEPDSPESSFDFAAASTVARLGALLEAAQFMHHLRTSPSNVPGMERIDREPGEQRLLIEKIPRLVLQHLRDPASAEAAFKSALNKVLHLQKLGLLAAVSTEEIFGSFLRVALSHGFHSIVRLALDPETAGGATASVALCQQVVLSAARELFDNADSGSKSHGLLRRACECLVLVPGSPDIQREQDLIDAVDVMIGKYGLLDHRTMSPMMPIQVRFHLDRLDLLRQLLSDNDGLYLSPELVLDLAQKLCGRQEATSPRAQLRIRIFFANSAMDHMDAEVAAHYCRELMRIAFTAPPPGSAGPDAHLLGDSDLAHSLADVLVRFAESDMPSQASTKLNLLSHALRICPPNRISRMLELWRMADVEAAAENLRDERATAKAQSQSEIRQVIVGAGSADRRHTLSAAHVRQVLSEAASSLAGQQPLAATSSVEHVLWNDFYLSPGASGQPAGLYSLESDGAMAAEDMILSAAIASTGLSDSAISGPTTTELLLSYAQRLLDRDALLALASVLNAMTSDPSASAGQVDSVRDIFARLGESVEANELAASFYATAASAVAGHQELDQNTREHLLQAWAGADQQPEQLTARDRLAWTLAEHAHAHHGRISSSKTRQIEDRLASRVGVDVARFGEDESYRLERLRAVAATQEPRRIQDCLELMDYLQLPRDQLALTQLEWLLASENVSAETLLEAPHIYSHFGNVASDKLAHAIADQHGRLWRGRLVKLLAAYQLLRGVLVQAGDRASADAIAARIELLGIMDSVPSLRGVSVGDLRGAAMAGEQGILQLWEVEPTRGRLESILAVLTKIKALEPISIFGDEVSLPTISLDVQSAASSLHAAYLGRAMAFLAANWSPVDSQPLVSLVQDVLERLPAMNPEHAFNVARHMVVGQLAMRTPLEIRKSILSALDKRLKDTESASWTQPLSVHLALLSGLADIDEQFFEIGGVPTYVVQQLDEACGDIKQITRTLDGLVTGLADPELVFAVANIVGSGFEPPVPEWALPELYRRAVSDAMRELEARCDEADPRLAQLEQLLSAVLGRAQGIHSSKPSAQTDDDGWGDEMALDDVLGPSPYEERMQETREVLRSVLSSAMSEISPLPVPLKMLALRTIQKYFVTQGQESSDLRVFGQATLVQHIWGIQIPASELGDPAQHEATLTQLMAESSTEQHVLGMAQLLAVWFEPEDGSLDTAAEALWMSLFTWAIDAGFDRLVFQIILKMRTKARIHDEMLLDKIQGSRDIVDFHRFALISMSSIVVDSMLSSLLDQIADSADFQELLFTSKNLLLLVLAHGYGPMLARLNLNWTKLCETLLVNTSGATEHSTALQRQFVAVLAADLVAAGSIFRASRLTQIYFSASSLLHAGPQADFILLRQLVALGAESAGVPFHVHTIPLSFAQDQAVPKFHASSDSLDVPSDDDAVLSHFLLDGGNALQQRFREKLGTALEILNGFIESF